MLKPDQLANKGEPQKAKPPAVDVNRCVLCGKPCHVSTPPYASYEVQSCPDCGTMKRDPGIARKALA